jgi:hypothetical protein
MPMRILWPPRRADPVLSCPAVAWLAAVDVASALAAAPAVAVAVDDAVAVALACASAAARAS